MASMKAMQKMVDTFNRDFPVGSQVVVRLDSGELKTTTVKWPASILGGHSAVAWLNGIVGCYLLDRVTRPEPLAAKEE